MSLRPSLYRVLTIKKDGVSADFRLAAVSIDFYEDILCPTVSCTIQIANSGGVIKNDKTGKYVSLYEGMKIRKGEEVELLIQSNSATNEDLDYYTNSYEPEESKYVYKKILLTEKYIPKKLTGFDCEAELVAELSRNLAQEIDREILGNLLYNE